MTNKYLLLIILVLSNAVFLSCSNNKNKKMDKISIQLIHDEKNQRVDILVDQKPFTSFLYTDTLSILKKPVFYPIYSADGAVITRGFPLEKRSGERVDHPHHFGMWLNHGNVNGIDFWNNPPMSSTESSDKKGVIRLDSILKIESGQDKGFLEVALNWINADGETMLKEYTKFTFSGSKTQRIIDRETKLTAYQQQIVFNDSKEGMMGIRVNRALEHPTNEAVVLTDDSGLQTKVPVLDNTGVTGHYLNNNGIEGMDVWGKRANWVQLSGVVDDETLSVTIFDHPDNIGYPSYWHARGYGLFAVNPLGDSVFSEGKEVLNLTLEPGQSVTFKYRVLIISGKADAAVVSKEYEEYIK